MYTYNGRRYYNTIVYLKTRPYKYLGNFSLKKLKYLFKQYRLSGFTGVFIFYDNILVPVDQAKKYVFLGSLKETINICDFLNDYCRKIWPNEQFPYISYFAIETRSEKEKNA